MRSSSIFKLLIGLVFTLSMFSCKVEELKAPQQEDLHEVIFHAGWDAETKTVLQEDGRIFWEPGDKINVFLTGGENWTGYPISSTIIAPAAKTDFVGFIPEKLASQHYVAVYPYNSDDYINPGINTVYVEIPQEQEAAEGTFGKNQFVCMAVSEDENLYFKTLCSGIKFSVSSPGISKIVVEALDGLTGRCAVTVFDDIESIEGYYSSVTVNAPSEDGFEPGKYYYATFFPGKINYGLTVSYYKDGKVASRDYSEPIEFKRGVFKRLYNKDEGLNYFKAYDSYALLPDNGGAVNLLPGGIDKTTITEAYFHTKSSVTTDIVIVEPALGSVYFEMIGNVAHFYTPADGYKVTNAGCMFKGWSSLRSVDISNFDTHECRSFHDMFAGCISLEDVDVSGIDTSNATEMYAMFAGCSSLKSLDLSNFNTENVTRMDNMFGPDSSVGGYNTQGCLSLQSLDLSSFNTSSVVEMQNMFSDCSGLKEVNLSGWNTENVKNMRFMFSGCSSLKTVDVSMFETKNVTDMDSMFDDCTNLQSIDVSNFNTAKVQSMTNMFKHCESLRELDLSNFSIESLNMFTVFPFCYSLKKIDLGTLSLPDDIYGAFTETARGSRACAIRCTNETKEAILNNHTFLMEPCITPEYFTWVLPGEEMPDLDDVRDPSLHYSTDFSMDGKSEMLHQATNGKGVEIVLMGDAYTDELIADGTYKKDMTEAMDAIFSIEPYKSLKSLISVRMVYVVSLNEKISGLTALWTGSGANGSLNGKTASYALSAVSNKLLSDIATIVISHDEMCLEGTGADGLTYHVFYYHDDDSPIDYGKSAYSECIIPKYQDTERFQFDLLHEFGHCFAKLGDEYVQYNSIIPDFEKNNADKIYSLLGANRNIDFTSDPAAIKWSRFLNDYRYNDTGLGIFEGGFCYSEGVWRPTAFSIMNNAGKVMFYNVPSREAIYNRIHKLAYGYDWEYDYEAFVSWDAPNIAADKEFFSTHPAQVRKSAVRSTKKPYLVIKDTVLPDGKKGKMIIMD